MTFRQIKAFITCTVGAEQFAFQDCEDPHMIPRTRETVMRGLAPKRLLCLNEPVLSHYMLYCREGKGGYHQDRGQGDARPPEVHRHEQDRKWKHQAWHPSKELLTNLIARVIV